MSHEILIQNIWNIVFFLLTFPRLSCFEMVMKYICVNISVLVSKAVLESHKQIPISMPKSHKPSS